MAASLRGRLVELIVGRSGLQGCEVLMPEERRQLISALDTLTHHAPAGLVPPLPHCGRGC